MRKKSVIDLFKAETGSDETCSCCGGTNLQAISVYTVIWIHLFYTLIWDRRILLPVQDLKWLCKIRSVYNKGCLYSVRILTGIGISVKECVMACQSCTPDDHEVCLNLWDVLVQCDVTAVTAKWLHHYTQTTSSEDDQIRYNASTISVQKNTANKLINRTIVQKIHH